LEQDAYNFFNSFVNISEPSFKKLVGISTYMKLEGYTEITQVGVIPQHLYLLTSGIMRAYLSAEDGKQYNKKIFSSFACVGALTGLIRETPSQLTYETLTECKVNRVKFSDFKQLCREDFEIGRLYVKILEYVFMDYESRNLDLMSLDATQRYLKLRKQIDNIDSLIPQFQIASYLGITSVQLSRIRKSLKEKEVC